VSFVDKLSVLGAGVIGGIVVSVTFVTVVAALAPWARIALGRVVIGLGPAVVETSVRGTEVVIRAVPLNAFVEPIGNELTADEPSKWEVPPGRVAALRASPWRRAVVFSFAPRLAILVLPFLVLGPARGARAWLDGFVDIARGAIGPFSTARELLDSAVATHAAEGYVTLVALTLCKQAAFDFLMLPGSLAGATRTGHKTTRPSVVALLAPFAPLIVGLVWLTAIIGWLVA
jgi:hypothetical protein